MKFSNKERKQLESINDKIDKLYTKKEKEYEKEKQKLRLIIHKKYKKDFSSLSKQREQMFKKSDVCKRCYGNGTIWTRACAEADKEEEKCPACKGSGSYREE